MLNKNAEKVLTCIIKKTGDNLEKEVHISHRDFKDKKITNKHINSICHELMRKGYIYSFYESVSENDNTRVTIKHEGYSYFDNKKTKRFHFWIPLIISNAISIAALIVAILAYIKQ